MPCIKLVNQTTNANILANLEFSEIGPSGSFLTVAGSCVTAGDVVSLTVGGKNVLNLAQPNIEISADVTDMSRDILVEREPVPPGNMIMAVTATTAVNVEVIIEDRPI